MRLELHEEMKELPCVNLLHSWILDEFAVEDLAD